MATELDLVCVCVCTAVLLGFVEQHGMWQTHRHCPHQVSWTHHRVCRSIRSRHLATPRHSNFSLSLPTESGKNSTCVRNRSASILLIYVYFACLLIEMTVVIAGHCISLLLQCYNVSSYRVSVHTYPWHFS